jgi:pyruvate formate lyase activating enzyme
MEISNGVKIGGLQKLTLIDYPGKIAATVFLIGCNFRCVFCYNSDFVLPEKIKKQKPIPQKDFFNFLKERKSLLDAVCVGGGEPTIWKDLPNFIKKIKKIGFLVKLDTNGSNPTMLRYLIDKKLVDYIAMDIKAPLSAKIQNPKATLRGVSRSARSNKIQNYEKVVGVRVNLNKIKKSIDIIKNSGLDYEFRTTVVPSLHTKEDILQIAREISFTKKYFLQNFLPKTTIDSELEKIKPYPQEFLLEIQKLIAPFFETCQIR